MHLLSKHPWPYWNCTDPDFMHGLRGCSGPGPIRYIGRSSSESQVPACLWGSKFQISRGEQFTDSAWDKLPAVKAGRQRITWPIVTIACLAAGSLQPYNPLTPSLCQSLPRQFSTQVWKLSGPSRRMFPVVVSYDPECDPLVHCQQTGTAHLLQLAAESRAVQTWSLTIQRLKC